MLWAASQLRGRVGRVALCAFAIWCITAGDAYASRWSLLEQRALAHHTHNGHVVVTATTPSIVRYLDWNEHHWVLGKRLDRTMVAIPKPGAKLRLPNFAKAHTVWLRIYQHKPGQLRVRVEGTGKTHASPSKGWSTLAVPLPKRHDEVQLHIVGRSLEGSGLAWATLAEPPLTTRGDEPFALAQASATHIEFPTGAGLRWHLLPPAALRLTTTIATGCDVLATHTVASQAPRSHRLQGRSRIDIDNPQRSAVALELTSTCNGARLISADAEVTAPPLRMPSGKPPKHVVLWIMDALRAQSIPAFTPGARAQTPTFDELAQTGLVFRQYYVQGNESQTSHSSVWTSLYPARHGVRTAGNGGTWQLRPGLTTIGEVMTQAGYTVEGITGNGYVNDNSGYAQGFAYFRNMMREKGIINGVLHGDKVVDAVLDRVTKLGAAPWFMLIGTVDNHGPWIARKPWIDQYSPRYKGPFKHVATAKELGMRRGVMGCSRVPAEPEIARLRAIYDSALSYSDAQLGRFVKALRAQGLWEDTLLIVTADHGEELFEDGRCGHGASLRDSLLRVPLLVHYPARLPAAVIDEGVEGVDVVPTLLDLLDQPALPTAQGAPVRTLLTTYRGWPRPSYASQYEYAHAMRIGTWKLRIALSGDEELYHLPTDAEEHNNLVEDRALERWALRDHLAMFLATRTTWRKAEFGVISWLTARGAAALDAIATLDRGWR